MKWIFCLICLLCFSFSLSSQEKDAFVFKNSDKKSQKIKFEMVNNLMILTFKVNGVPTNFLVDTGISKTLLFSFEDPNLLNTESLNRVKVRGFGGDETLYAYRSQRNELQLEGLINKNATLYLFFENEYNLTNKLGINVNGIIGYELFKDFVVKLNYEKKNLRFYPPQKFSRKLRRYQKKELEFFREKPYIYVNSSDKSIVADSLKLLIDTGSSDALWLIENEIVRVKNPHFDDVIGYGFTGLIEGKRSRLKNLSFNRYRLPEVNVAYPDSISYSFLDEIKQRDGSLGGELLRRFTWFFDYPNQRIYFQANRNFDDPFIYDMSGLVLKYDGYEVIQKSISQGVFIDDKDGYGNTNKNRGKQINLKFEVVDRLKIAAIRPNSPAYYAGLLPEDEILEINNKPAFEKNLDQMTKLLSSGHNKYVKLTIKRNEEIIEVRLKLQDRLLKLGK